MSDNIIENELFSFEQPSGPAPFIKVIGVGGGGSNAVNYMYGKGVAGVDFIVCNTDGQALSASPVPNKIVLDQYGTGGDPELGREYASAKREEIKEALSNGTRMLFIAAGMGGGTGTGAAPVIAQIAKEIETGDKAVKKILVVAVVTKPFDFEANERMGVAVKGIEELSKYVDATIVINNEKLRSAEKLGMSKAYARVDDVLYTAVKGISESITGCGVVNVDFRDVNKIMENSGRALIGTGIAKGENRAKTVLEMATNSSLLDDESIKGARRVLLQYYYSTAHEITIDEITDIGAMVRKSASEGVKVIFGATIDESLDESIKLTIVATDFERNNNQSVTTNNPLPPTPPTPAPPKETKPDELGITTYGGPNTEPTPADKGPVYIPLEPDNEGFTFPGNNVSNQGTSISGGVKTGETIILTVEDEKPEPEKKEEKKEDNPFVVKQGEPMKEEKGNNNDPFGGSSKPENNRGETFVMPKRDTSDFDKIKEGRDRIKYINDLLRGDPNGIEAVKNMRNIPAGDEIEYHGVHSSVSERAEMFLAEDGTVLPSLSLQSNPPD